MLSDLEILSQLSQVSQVSSGLIWGLSDFHERGFRGFLLLNSVVLDRTGHGASARNDELAGRCYSIVHAAGTLDNRHCSAKWYNAARATVSNMIITPTASANSTTLSWEFRESISCEINRTASTEISQDMNREDLMARNRIIAD